MALSEGGLVFSTEQGRMCPECRNPVDECTCKQQSAPAGDGGVRVSRETKGRKGKGVTLITGIPLAGNELKALAKTPSIDESRARFSPTAPPTKPPAPLIAMRLRFSLTVDMFHLISAHVLSLKRVGCSPRHGGQLVQRSFLDLTHSLLRNSQAVGKTL